MRKEHKLLFDVDKDSDSDDGKEEAQMLENGVHYDKVTKKQRIRIDQTELNNLKDQAQSNNCPLIQEYAYYRDRENPLKIELRPNTLVRDY
jgi:hypothetical protein